ncbi:MAG: DUF2264 domain-containing protein [Alistipes sp.]|nr:DUF2264 domain-containing protein [Candidatus Minthomonas equi]
MKKLIPAVLILLMAASATAFSQTSPNNINESRYSQNPDRNLWVSSLDRICRPVLENLAAGTLKLNMPIESVHPQGKENCTYLEALGRIIVGISPWLELGPDDSPEGKLRAEYIKLCTKSIANAVNPDSPDHLNFNDGSQPLVDAAFLVHGLLRAPEQLFGNLDSKTRERLKTELISSRAIKPYESNWLLFSAMIEAGLLKFYGECDMNPIEYAMNRFLNDWYVGDGQYSDGEDYHSDFYNSFVIQPMMVQIVETLNEVGYQHDYPAETILERYARYAAIQEMMISPEGTYPAIGRSIAYRFGAFHALSDVCLRHLLPETVTPAQVRCALTAVIKRQVDAPGTFDEKGWLTVGFCGHQLHMGESYISTGSVYLCNEAFVALGLPETDPFWSDPARDWSGKKAWSGADMKVDHAL